MGQSVKITKYLGINIPKAIPTIITEEEKAAMVRSHSKSVPEEINKICKEAKMDIAQIHFEVDELFLEALDVDYLCVVRAKTKEDVKQFYGKKRLIDAYVESYGGAGQRLELSWFDDADRENIILAGGLNPENLEQITPLGFFGVDVSSGVEKAKGLKNHDLVREFVCKAKA